MLHYASPYLPYMLIHCKHLPAGNGGVKLNGLQSSAQEGWCVYMWLSLWPFTLHWCIRNANKRRHPADFVVLHVAPLKCGEGKGSTSLKAPCHFGGHMFPIENSLPPSGHISVSLWFKPETNEGLFLFSPSWNDFHRLEFWAKYHYSLAKKVHWRLFLHFIITNGPRKHDMGRRSTGNERRHVCFTEWVEFTYLFPLAQNHPAFK